MFSRSIRSAICGRCQLYKIQNRTKSVESSIAKVQEANTRIVKHARRIPPTPPGQSQRPPSDKQEFQMYEFAEDTQKEYPPVKIILLKSVDGVGIRGDVVSVSSDEFHNVLFPMGSAIYATPYDLKCLEEQRKAGEFAQLAPEDLISFEHKKFARVLNKTLIKITMTFDDSWILEKRHVRINLRRNGFIVEEDNIVMPAEPIKGPNKNMQGKIIQFYVKHTPHCVVPVFGYIDQVSSKSHQLIVAAGQDETKMAAEVSNSPIHYSAEPLNLDDEEIRSLMASRTDVIDKQQTVKVASS